MRKALFLASFLFFGNIFAEDKFPYNPPPHFALSPEYIALHHPVQTSNPGAQAFFDQGLTFYYAFNNDAAYWSFLQAAALDPSLAMAYWGMALSLGANINTGMSDEKMQKAYRILEEAKKHTDKSPQHEKDYIQALSARYSDNPSADKKKLAKAYSDAMRDLKNKYPDDADAAALFVGSLLDLNPWAQWSPDGQPLEGTMEALETARSGLLSNPDHIGMNHFYIHAVETSPYPERGLISAQRLESLHTSLGHIIHMPSHIYFAMGDYRKAVQVNEEAEAADKKYIERYGAKGTYPVNYLAHTFYYLARAAVLEGNFCESMESARKLQEHYLKYMSGMPYMEYYYTLVYFVLGRFYKWEEIIKLEAPPEKMAASTLYWHYIRALAFASLNDIANAKKEEQLFRQEAAKVPDELHFAENDAKKVANIASLAIKGKILEKEGKIQQAIKIYSDGAEQLEKTLVRGAPDWFFPFGDFLGGVLLRNGIFEEAETTFRKQLDMLPRNGRSLFGLLLALKGLTKTNQIYWVDQEFQNAWLYADVDLNVKDY